MQTSGKIKKFIVFCGDIICFYLALFLMLVLRFMYPLPDGIWLMHFGPFSVVFAIWLLVFYIGHLYEISENQNKWNFFRLLFELQIINFIIAVLFFYIYPTITPKTNLALVIVFSLALITVWRLIFNKLLMRTPGKNVLILGGGKEAEELKRYFDKKPQLGYKVAEIVSNPSSINGETLLKLIKNGNIDTLVVDKLGDQIDFRRVLFNNLFFKINIFDLAEFYEINIRKIPISAINESWFLTNSKYLEKHGFGIAKRIIDFILAVVCLVITLPFWPLIAILIKIDSRGPIFFTHERVGQDGNLFKIIKFRSMVANAKDQGPHWTEKNDRRITKLGNFLRKAHIDEFPQFINIIKGDVSFVGPRPEEKELVELYSKEIPYYQIRHFAKPGMLGWAQFNYPHGASVEDAIQKLQYDFYYVKNRSLWLDLSIIIRVVRIILTQPTH